MNSFFLRPLLRVSLYAFLTAFPVAAGLVMSPRSAGNAPPKVQSAMNPYLYGCNETEQQIVLEAWREAATLAQDHFEWFPKTKWQDAMTLYIGKGSEDDYGWFTGEGPLEKNTRRQYNIHHGGFLDDPILTYGYFYCHEKDLPLERQNPNGECGQHTTAYTFNDLGFFWSAHYVVFCPTFFSPRMNSLSEQTEVADGDLYMQNTMDYWRKTRARSVFHETYHWKTTVSVPSCNLVPEVYKPQPVVDLAASDMSKSVINAESWAQASLAIYLQKTFNLTKPPVPAGYRGSEQVNDPVLVDATKLEEKGLDRMPDGFIPPVKTNSETFNPDMENVVQLGTLGPLTNDRPPVCEEGAYATMDRCSVFCAGGQCSQDDSKQAVTCSGCGKEKICSNGSYEDYDACFASCDQGLCIESAGIDGITCECS